MRKIDVSKFNHKFLGNNYRMIDLLAAIGNVQIQRFEKTLRLRREKVTYYKEQLKNISYPEKVKDTVNCIIRISLNHIPKASISPLQERT